jgi:phosphate starvation-inducible protein PhoH
MQAKDTEQRKYLEALRDPNIRHIICKGMHGTGKTVLAVVEALRWLDDKVRHQEEDDEWRIILSRPPITALGGSFEENLEDLARPMTDAIRKWTTPKDQWKALLEKSRIERKTFDRLRGMTLDEAFVIIDEVRSQRCTRATERANPALRTVYCLHSLHKLL